MLVPRNFSWLPNPDGTVDGHNPLGDKDPHVSALAWGDLSAFIAAIQQTATGSSVSANARAALSGTNAATATITWETWSGSDVTATGFTVSGSNVLISSATAGGGFGRLGANDGTGIVYSAPIQWTRIAAPTDVLAPTTPTGLLGTPATGGIVWTWDPASDPHDGTHAGAGVKEYDLELNGAVTVVAGLPGIVSVPTVSNIGSISNPGAPTAVQAGRNWTLTAAGTGADGTSDQILFLNWPLSGDCRVVAKINSVGGAGSTFGVAGLMMRESLAVGSKYVALDQFRTAQSQAIQGKQRLTTGGARSNLSTGTGTNTPRWVMIERIGDVFTLSYSLDGMAWVALDTTTLPMTSSIFIGGFATSLSAGNEVIGVLNDLNVSTSPRLSYTQTTSSATAARVRARDLQGTPNVGSYCPLSPSVSPLAGAAKKWDPGFYPFESNYSTYNATRLNEILALANTQGYKIRIRWREIETSRGTYSFTFLDGLLAICAAAGKRLIIEVISNSFDGNNPLPAYLATETNAAGGWYVKVSPLSGYQAKVYNAAVKARLYALATALATQYDSHPNVAGFMFLPESSLPQAPSDYSDPGYKAALIDYATVLPALFVNTPVFIGMNFGFAGNKSYWPDLYAALKSGKCGTTNPDIYINSDDNSSFADKASRGLIWNGSAWIAGGIDYRGMIPIMHDIQSPELGGKENTGSGQTLATLMTHDTTVNKSHFVCPLYKDYAIAPTPPNDVYWDHTKSYAVNKVSGSQDIKTMISGGAVTLASALPIVFGGHTGDEVAVFAFPLSAGHSYTQKVSLAAIFPRPDTDSGIGSWERHKLQPSGVPLRFPIMVQGGIAPFQYSVSGPSGMVIGNNLPLDWDTNGPQGYGMLKWANPVVGTHSITVTVTDQAGSQLTVNWSLVVASRDDTTKFRFYDSTNGSNSNAGSYSAPYKDDLSKVFGVASTDTTFQGHVIFINRGTSYVIPSNTNLTHQTPLDNTKRPVVFYSMPTSATVRNKATLSFASTRIYFGNMTGMCWGELTFDGGVSTDSNYTNVLIGDGQDRLTVFGVDGTNLTNGSVGDDNTTMFGAATGATTTDSTYNHYVAFYDCQELGRPSGSNASSLWDWYGVKYMVAEFCVTGPNTPGMNWKDSSWHTTSRYCKVDNQGSGNFGIDLLGVSQNGGTNGYNEFVYFRGRASDGGASRAVRLNAFGDTNMGPCWVSRSSFSGVVDIKLPNTSTGPYVIENVAIQSSGSPAVTAGSNITNTGTECQGSSGIMDATTLKLINASRTNHLGDRGYEIA